MGQHKFGLGQNARIDLVCEAYKAGRGAQEIADEHGVSEMTIFRVLHKHGVPMRKKTVTASVIVHNTVIANQQEGRLRGKYKR